MKLHICFDLGGDTLKVAFAFKNNNIDYSGKLMNKNYFHFAFPAHAYYDENSNEWYYGDLVDRVATTNFRTVVKIKTLLNLLRIKDNENRDIKEEVRISNTNYFTNEYFFPAFHFPKRLAYIKNYGNFITANESNTFKANKTPQDVCVGYFLYIKKCLEKQIKMLESTNHVQFDEREYMAIFPLGSGMFYEKKLKEIIDNVFITNSKVDCNAIQVISKFLEHQHIITDGDNALIFDMGEDNISVARTNVSKSNGRIVSYVEGADGHSQPLSLGGVDIDEAISKMLVGNIDKRETVGTESYGNEEHIVESGLISKQYQLMNDIKFAKISLSDQASLFDYLSVTVSRDLVIQCPLLKSGIESAIGISKSNGFAKKILDYIIKEINRSNNSDVNKVFLAGGVIETFGLEDYLFDKLKKKYPDIKFEVVKAVKNTIGNFTIETKEDSVYAAAIAGAYVSLYSYKIETRLSKSYGTYYDTIDVVVKGVRYQRGRYYFVIADKGVLLSNNEIMNGKRYTKIYANGNFFVANNKGGERVSSSVDEMYLSSKYGLSDFNGLRFIYTDFNKKNDNKYPYIGFMTSELLTYDDKACEELGINLDKKIEDKIVFKYKNERVSVKGNIKAKQGFLIFEDGVVVPFIENDRTSNLTEKVYIETYFNGRQIARLENYNVLASDIEVCYLDGVIFSI